MQHVRCVVRLSGDIAFSVHKEDLTVAEVALLRVMHGGDDAVVDIIPTHKDRLSTIQHKRALLAKYKDGTGADLIEKLFPGLAPTLPVSLADIGMEMDPETMDARPKGARSVRVAVPADDDAVVEQTAQAAGDDIDTEDGLAAAVAAANAARGALAEV